MLTLNSFSAELNDCSMHNKLSTMYYKCKTDNFIKKSFTASHFTASLELVKEGVINVRQHAPFAPIYIKKKNNKK